MMPLLGENRYLVKQGLKLINASPRLGIREMIIQAGLSGGSLDSESISWSLAPRLNAAGRLEHAMSSYRLLLTDFPIGICGLVASKLAEEFYRPAGFTLPTRNLPRLQQALLELATTQLDGVDLRPKLDIDAETSLSDLGGDTFPIIQKLAPFGRGNPAPTFLSRQVEVITSHTMGTNGEHRKEK